jgi:hypothetical protein
LMTSVSHKPSEQGEYRHQSRPIDGLKGWQLFVTETPL